MKYKYVIIGTGPTGLGAAYRLKELGINDFVLLDKEDYVGGLATSFVDGEGFTWDIGGHVQFSHYRYFDQLMLKALGPQGWLNHQRESWVWIRNGFVPYPFQNNIRYLPQTEMWDCLNGLIELYKTPFVGKPANFHEWILATLGKGIAEVFMLPYNFKVWAYPPAEMSYSWIGERVSVADLQRVTENIIFGKDDFSWGPNNTFQFPKHGGTGAIWKAVGEDLIGLDHIRLRSEVTSVIPTSKTIQLADGTSIQYEQLLNTMPIDLFCQKVEGLDEQIVSKAQGLKYSSTNVIGIGLKGKPKSSLATKCWMYFPESNSPYYRITVFSNYSPYNVPAGEYWSLMTETSESVYKPVNQETLMADTIQALLADGLIESDEDIVSQFQYRTQYGYPTPSVERDGILGVVQPALEALGVFSRGRFGTWKYEISNQDHSLMQGVEWVNRMELGIPELTYHFPETANANWGKK